MEVRGMKRIFYEIDKYFSQLLSIHQKKVKLFEGENFWYCPNFNLLKHGFFTLEVSLYIAYEYRKAWENEAMSLLSSELDLNKHYKTNQFFSWFLSSFPETKISDNVEEPSRYQQAKILCNTHPGIQMKCDTPKYLIRSCEGKNFMPNHGVYLKITDDGYFDAGVYVDSDKYKIKQSIVSVSSLENDIPEKIINVFQQIVHGTKSLDELHIAGSLSAPSMF